MSGNDSTEEIARLRAELARREQLLRTATDALVRDASEVVRVLSELERRDVALKEELHLALRFQRAMLGPLPTDTRVTCAAVHLAAEVISGDFYDVAMLGPPDSRRLRLFIADVTGHGIAAGLGTMFVKSEYEAQKRLAAEPRDVLREMNELLCARYGLLGLRFTALCLDVDLDARRVVYATAAHPAPLVARADRVETLASGGTFIGLVGGVEFPQREAQVEPGDILLTYTDGLVDTEGAPRLRGDETGGPDQTSFGEARVADYLRDARDKRTPVCNDLVRALSTFVGEKGRLADDVAMVALSFTP